MLTGRQLDSNPFLTIVTVTKDNLEGLYKTRNSILNGTKEIFNISHLIIDGGSTPAAFLDQLRLQDLSTQYISREPRGIFQAMNESLSQVTSNFVLFLNAGDTFHPNCNLAHLISVLERDKPSWLVGKAAALNTKGQVIDWKIPDHLSIKLRLGINSYPHQATIYSRELFLSGLRFDESSFVADWSLSLELSKISPPTRFEEFISCNAPAGQSAQIGIATWARNIHHGRKSAKVKVSGVYFLDRSIQYLIGAAIAIKRIFSGF
jgi:glycosyltransferase involved in cell wall biosynthesis